MIQALELIVDESKIKRAVQSGIPLTITIFTLPREMELYIEKVLTVFLRLAFLRLANREKFKDYLVYCAQELAVNAKKANTKRVYFMEKGLDLTLPDEYKEGMKDFKKVTLNDPQQRNYHQNGAYTDPRQDSPVEAVRQHGRSPGSGAG